MLRSIVRKIRATTTQTLFRKNIYHMNNEVPRFDSSKNYYSILEIHKESSESEVKQAYYRLAKAYHPDSNPGKQSKFKEINEAYSVLSDAKLRKQYNSARMFSDFSRRMGRRSQQTNYNYEEMRRMYDNLSKEQKEQINEQTVRKIRKGIYFGLVMIILLPFITRRNHRYYVLEQGQLVPVQFEGGFKGGMVPPPNYMNPYGAPAPYPGPQGGGIPPNYSGPQSGMAPNYPPPPSPYYQNQAPSYQSPYNQQQRPSYADPYSSVVQNIHHQPPSPPVAHPTYRQQTNLQPGYGGPVAPE